MSDQGYDRAITSISDLPLERNARKMANSQESVADDTISLVSKSSSKYGRSVDQPKVFQSRLNNDILLYDFAEHKNKPDEEVFSLQNAKLKSNDSIENIEPILQQKASLREQSDPIFKQPLIQPDQEINNFFN